jgi:chromosome partitioning protein
LLKRLTAKTASGLEEAYRVKLCDLDIPQGSTVDWYRRRLQHGSPPLASVQSYRSVEDALANGVDMPPGFDAVVIDAAGRSSEATLRLAQQATSLSSRPQAPSTTSIRPSVSSTISGTSAFPRRS